MDIDHMVKMANQIADFFDSEMGQEAPSAIALHISRYWDPRMRRHILEHLRKGGEGLSASAAAAIRSLPPVKETPQTVGA